MAKLSIYITPKPTLLDAQGRTVAAALGSLGFENITDLRIGKLIELHLPDADTPSLHQTAVRMCETLLANPVTESYRIEIETGAGK